MALTIILASLLFIVSLIFFLSKRNPKYNLPPGPYNPPFVGNLHQFRDLPHRALRKLSKHYGPLIYLKLGTIPTVVASSPATASEFLKNHDLDCCSRPTLTALVKLSYGFSDIAFAPYGEQWRELRKICMLQLFSTKKVTSFHSVRAEEVSRMMLALDKSVNKEINLTEEMLKLANNIASRTALGKAYYSEGGRLDDILTETQALLNGFFLADYIPVLGFVDYLNGMRARLETNFRDLDAFYQKVINEHRDPKRQRRDGEEDAIDALLEMQETGNFITDDHIKGVLMNIFIAGTETSAVVMEWSMSQMMRKPAYLKKAQDEVRSIIGDKKKFEESDLDKLQYLRCVIKEVMRLHGPMLLPRETTKDLKVNGYDIPAKTRLFINSWAIGSDENVWERPAEFIPERFMESAIDFRGHHFELIPFGAGRRICPGMNTGMLTVELALSNLLCLYDWELPEGMKVEDINMEEAPGLTMRKNINLSLVPRKHVF